MGQYSTDVNMEFGTTLRFKKEFEYGIFTFPIGEEVRVANYVHKYYVEIYHKQVQDLIKVKVELIDDLLEEVKEEKQMEQSCIDCKWCKLGGEFENDECHNTSLSAHLEQGTMVSQDFCCNRWEQRQ